MTAGTKTDLFCRYLLDKVFDFYSDPQNIKKFKRWYKKKYGKHYKPEQEK